MAYRRKPTYQQPFLYRIYLRFALTENNFTLYKDALSDIAVCYELGNGVQKDKQKAYYYYFLAALNGDLQAKQELSRCLYYGIGIKKDVELSSLIDKFVLI